MKSCSRTRTCFCMASMLAWAVCFSNSAAFRSAANVAAVSSALCCVVVIKSNHFLDIEMHNLFISLPLLLGSCRLIFLARSSNLFVMTQHILSSCLQSFLESVEPGDCSLHFCFCRSQLSFCGGDSVLGGLITSSYATFVQRVREQHHLFSLNALRFKSSSVCGGPPRLSLKNKTLDAK